MWWPRSINHAFLRKILMSVLSELILNTLPDELTAILLLLALKTFGRIQKLEIHRLHMLSDLLNSVRLFPVSEILGFGRRKNKAKMRILSGKVYQKLTKDTRKYYLGEKKEVLKTYLPLFTNPCGQSIYFQHLVVNVATEQDWAVSDGMNYEIWRCVSFRLARNDELPDQRRFPLQLAHEGYYFNARDRSTRCFKCEHVYPGHDRYCTWRSDNVLFHSIPSPPQPPPTIAQLRVNERGSQNNRSQFLIVFQNNVLSGSIVSQTFSSLEPVSFLTQRQDLAQGNEAAGGDGREQHQGPLTSVSDCPSTESDPERMITPVQDAAESFTDVTCTQSPQVHPAPPDATSLVTQDNAQSGEEPAQDESASDQAGPAIGLQGTSTALSEASSSHQNQARMASVQERSSEAEGWRLKRGQSTRSYTAPQPSGERELPRTGPDVAAAMLSDSRLEKLANADGSGQVWCRACKTQPAEASCGYCERVVCLPCLIPASQRCTICAAQ